MKIRKYEFDFKNRTYICGILNVTPDSFSDGGKNTNLDDSLENALHMIFEGALIIDVGGESTRPGYTPVNEKEEMKRVIPFIEALRGKSDIPISIDTSKASVAQAAVEAGADIINDVSGLLADPRMLQTIKDTNAYCIIVHNSSYVNQLCRDEDVKIYGTSGESKENIGEDYVNQHSVEESYIKRVYSEMELLAQRAVDAGIDKDKIILDPGVGFKGSVEKDHFILNNLPMFTQIGYPILLGASRKSCIAAVCGGNIREREAGTVAVSTLATLAGVGLLRVHNVKDNACAVRLTEEICKYE